MYVYQINSTGWAFVQPHIWLQSETKTDEDGYTDMPNITPVCHAFFEMGRRLMGRKEVKSVDVLRLPAKDRAKPLCVLVMFVDGTTFLASPYELPWLGEALPMPSVPLPESQRTQGRVIDSRNTVGESMLTSLINAMDDGPLKSQLNDIYTILTGGTVEPQKGLNDQERALMAGITVEGGEVSDATRGLQSRLFIVLDTQNVPGLAAIQAWDDHTFELVEAWTRSVEKGGDRDPMPDALAEINTHKVYAVLKGTFSINEHLTFGVVMDWSHAKWRAAYKWAVNEIQAQAEGYSIQEPDFLTQYVERKT